MHKEENGELGSCVAQLYNLAGKGEGRGGEGEGEGWHRGIYSRAEARQGSSMANTPSPYSPGRSSRKGGEMGRGEENGQQESGKKRGGRDILRRALQS